jgi:predicted NBD/HSP70 family sugar kinase
MSRAGETTPAVWEYSTKFAKLAHVHQGLLEDMERAWSQALGVSVFLVNDGDAAAVAEYEALKEAGEKLRHLLVITLAASIGTEFILGGRLHVGPYGGRASHLVLDPQGAACAGEQHAGCWKTVASANALMRRAAALGLTVTAPEDLTSWRYAGFGRRSAVSRITLTPSPVGLPRWSASSRSKRLL